MKLKILVIIGSTRPKRFSEKPAKWIYDLAKARKEFDVELIDLRDYPLPFYDEETSPARLAGKYKTPVADKWAAKIESADGFIIVSPEYNHGYPAVLKNAMDYVYTQWNKKAVGFVSYGGVGGARVVEQLRLVAVELQLAPIRAAVHIPVAQYMDVAGATGAKEIANALEPVKTTADIMLDMLAWWTRALKVARKTDA